MAARASRRKQAPRRSKKRGPRISAAASKRADIRSVESPPGMPWFVTAAGGPRSELIDRAMAFKGPVEENKPLLELRKIEALMGVRDKASERILDYLRICSETPAPAARANAELRAGKKALSEAALEEHLRLHPWGKLRSDGSKFSMTMRVDALKKEQDIVISRTWLGRRIASYLQQHATIPSSD